MSRFSVDGALRHTVTIQINFVDYIVYLFIYLFNELLLTTLNGANAIIYRRKAQFSSSLIFEHIDNQVCKCLNAINNLINCTIRWQIECAHKTQRI